jgi:predicted RNA-binding Zn-ribbon protein involved in translation (DUF1610 family)
VSSKLDWPLQTITHQTRCLLHARGMNQQRECPVCGSALRQVSERKLVPIEEGAGEAWAGADLFQCPECNWQGP